MNHYCMVLCDADSFGQYYSELLPPCKIAITGVRKEAVTADLHVSLDNSLRLWLVGLFIDKVMPRVRVMTKI